FQDLFARPEQRDWFRFFLCGQLSNQERKTVEPMVLELLGTDGNAIRAAQYFLGQAPWDTTPFLERVQTLVADWLGEPDGVVVVDGSGFPKQGSHSVGVAPQYCGHLGKVANCQEGVFALYASRRGHAFVDRRLYLPKDWFTPEYRKRWQACGIPDDLPFHTEPELGLAMVTQLVQRAVVPFRWVTCDERYAEIPAFLDGIAALGKWYLAEVAVDTRAWLRTPAVEPPGQGLLGAPRKYPRVRRSAPRPYEMRELILQIPRAQWQRRFIKAGSKGPMLAEFACLRVTPVRDGLPGERCWVVFRRTLGPQPEVKFFLSNAPRTCPLQEFVRVSGLRWPVETGLEEGKGEVGMDQYETRTWLGWHHQMTLSILTHLFLVRLQLVLQKKPSVDHRASASAHCPRHRRRSGPVTRHAGHCALSPAPKLRRVSVAPQARPVPATPAPRKAAEMRLLVVMGHIS
ncbi:MAG TPA: IS701 family transposase, partial [Anaerolineales bacterium]